MMHSNSQPRRTIATPTGGAIALLAVPSLLLSPLLSSGAIAGYVPPADASAPASGNTSTNTVRGGGCNGTSATSLTALAPHDHIGHTASTQPTLVWFSPEEGAYNMEFRIVEYGPNSHTNQQFIPVYETEFVSTERTSVQGIGQFDLSESNVTLTPGKSYRWQVVMVCNPSFPSESLMAEADLMVAPMPAAIAPVETDSLANRVDTYASAGLWYDAMAEAVRGDSSDAQNVQAELLETLVELAQEAHTSADTVPTLPTLDGVIEANLTDGAEATSLQGTRLQAVIDSLTAPDAL